MRHKVTHRKSHSRGQYPSNNVRNELSHYYPLASSIRYPVAANLRGVLVGWLVSFVVLVVVFFLVVPIGLIQPNLRFVPVIYVVKTLRT